MEKELPYDPRIRDFEVPASPSPFCPVPPWHLEIFAAARNGLSKRSGAKMDSACFGNTMEPSWTREPSGTPIPGVVIVFDCAGVVIVFDCALVNLCSR